MKIEEFTGIIVVKCQCEQRFVVNTENIKNGFRINCKCGKQSFVPRWSTTELNIVPIQFSEHWDTSVKTAYRKPVNEAMTLEEYRMILADAVISGKTPKVNTKHKGVVSIDMNDQQVADAYEALRSLGYKKQEAMNMLDIALSTGLRRTSELLNSILSL